MSTATEPKFDPSDIPPHEAERLQRLLESDARPFLIAPGGDPVELPDVLNDLFMHVLEAMMRQEVIFLVHEDEAFTTQAAANYLGVSRQFLVRLLEQGEIPFHRANTHRKVLFKDLLAYRQARSKSRKSKLDKMTETIVEAGADEKYVDLTRSEEE